MLLVMNFFRTDAINCLDKKQKQASLIAVGYHGRRQFDNNLTEMENPKLSTWHRSVFLEQLGDNNHSFACFAYRKELCLSRFSAGGSIIFIIIVYSLQMLSGLMLWKLLQSFIYLFSYCCFVFIYLLICNTYFPLKIFFISTGQENNRTKQKISHLIFSSFLTFNCCLSVVLSLDEGDYPENMQIVCLCHNK